MSEARRQDWDLATFLAWEASQPARYELADDAPRLMTGGSQAHNLISLNITTNLRGALRGFPCRPGGSDLRVVTGNGNGRYPDALIDCGPFRPASHDASEPVAVFEMLSRSAAWIDPTIRLRDYDATPSILLYAVVAQDEPHVAVWRRDPSGRLIAALTGRELALELELPAAAGLRLADIYDGLPKPAAAPA